MTTQTKLTDRQTRLLIAIARFWDEHGFSPAYRDLLMMADFSSQSLVSTHLHHLERSRLITCERNISRSIVLTERGQALASELA